MIIPGSLYYEVILTLFISFSNLKSNPVPFSLLSSYYLSIYPDSRSAPVSGHLSAPILNELHRRPVANGYDVGLLLRETRILKHYLEGEGN